MWTVILILGANALLNFCIKYVMRKKRVRAIEEGVSVLTGRKVSRNEFLDVLEKVRVSTIERAKWRAENTASLVRSQLRSADRHPDSLEHHLWADNLNLFLCDLRQYLVEGGGYLKLEDLDFSANERAEIRKLLPAAVEVEMQKSYRPH
jgi:hypothetical protein